MSLKVPRIPCKLDKSLKDLSLVPYQTVNFWCWNESLFWRFLIAHRLFIGSDCEERICFNSCPDGFQLDKNGCQTCKCHNPCQTVNCVNGTKCLIQRVRCQEFDITCMPTKATCVTSSSGMTHLRLLTPCLHVHACVSCAMEWLAICCTNSWTDISGTLIHADCTAQPSWQHQCLYCHQWLEHWSQKVLPVSMLLWVAPISWIGVPKISSYPEFLASLL